MRRTNPTRVRTTARAEARGSFSRVGRLEQVAALLAFLLPTVAWADVVEPLNRSAATGVRILEIKAGHVLYHRTPDRVVTRPIDEIALLEITDWPPFNQAEQHRRHERWRQAGELYEQALADLPAALAEPGQLDRRLLVACRLVGVYDAQGRFDRAVKTYLEILERMPEAVDSLRPVNLPVAGSTFLPAAASAVEAAIRRHEHTPLGAALTQWRATWPDESPDASDAHPTTSPAADHPPHSGTVRELAEQVKASRFDDAVDQATAALRSADRILLAELYYWLGRARQGRMTSLDGADGLREARRAGLAFMRVVIHFPRHDRAAESLYHAGTLCREAGQADQAQRLWSELLREYPQAAPWAGQAREALRRMEP